MSDAVSNGTADCPSCGAVGVGGLAGCRALFDKLTEPQFSDRELGPALRLMVDAYSLQHPEEFMRSSKSAAAHLSAMCWSMERGRSSRLPAPLKAWVDGPRTYPCVPPPPSGARGALSLLALVGATDAVDHDRRALAWAESAWEAWSAHWPQARDWVREALAEAGQGAESSVLRREASGA